MQVWWTISKRPAPLTLEALRRPHGSVPRNPRICEVLFLARYIEKYGTGTLMMIRESLAHALPEPDFAQRGGEFTIAVWRDWLTDEVIQSLGTNDRQILCLKVLKVEQQITTMEYQSLAGCSRRTAARDLDELLAKGAIQRLGAGRSAHYVLSRHRAVNLPIVPSAVGMTSLNPEADNHVINVPNVPSDEARKSKPTAVKTGRGRKEPKGS